jgi:simple sugar transport system substrate-binding protein
VAQERGVHGFGQASDMRVYAPKAQLTAILDDWSSYYTTRAQELIAGTWKSHSVWYGLKEGMVKMAPYGDAVPEEARKAATEVEQGIIAGTLHPFTGPIRNQAGEVKIPAGQHASDEEMLKMDWYVEGVQA